jgi:hypothetical protein
MQGLLELLPLPCGFVSSFLISLEQKWKYSYTLKLKSLANALFPASLLSPFLFSFPIHAEHL